ncbi:hypothetical protein D3C78_1094960 [compost metagenome]
MLYGTHALTHGEPKILGSHIVLVIHESLGLAGITVARQFGVRDAAAGAVMFHHKGGRVGGLAERCCNFTAPLSAVLQRGLDAPEPASGPGNHAVLVGGGRKERSPLVIPGDLALRMGKEMQRRRPAAGHQHRVAGDVLPRTNRRTIHRIDPD